MIHFNDDGLWFKNKDNNKCTVVQAVCQRESPQITTKPKEVSPYHPVNNLANSRSLLSQTFKLSLTNDLQL